MNLGTRLDRVERSIKTLREKIDQNKPPRDVLLHLSGLREALDKLAAEFALQQLEGSLSKLLGRELVARQWPKNLAVRPQTVDEAQIFVDDLAQLLTHLMS